MPAETTQQAVLEPPQNPHTVEESQVQTRTPSEPAPVEGPRPEATPVPDYERHAEALESAHERANSLMTTIQGHTETATATSKQIEQVRLSAEMAKAEIDAQVTHMREAVAGLAQQVETARTSGTELSTLLASAQSAHKQSEETAKQASAAIESAKQVASTAAETIGRIEAIRDEAVKTQATIAERNAFIQNGLEHVAEVQRKLDAELDVAKRAAASAESHQATAKTTSDSVSELHASVQTVKNKANDDAEVVASMRATVQEHANATKRLAQLADSTETRVSQYEAKLTEMQETARELQTRIDSLLLGATNAGLASAFDKRSKAFQAPERQWQWIFLGSLAGLLALAIWQAVVFGNLEQVPDWQQLARMMLFKLPFLLPLIWLAIHAGRQASFAKRMEEEYAFKATTSMSFEGYRRQMAEVGKDLGANSPLAQLCNNTLKTIAAPPGKVYDKQRMDPTPGTAAADIVGPVVGAGKTTADK